MKNHIIAVFILLVLTFINFVSAGDTINYEAALENYLVALNSDNTGLVESGIENLIKLKVAVPEMDFNRASEVMETLSKTGKTNSICYKAFIGHLYLNHPERFNWLNSDSQDASFGKLDEMFAKIDLQLSK